MLKAREGSVAVPSEVVSRTCRGGVSVPKVAEDSSDDESDDEQESGTRPRAEASATAEPSATETSGDEPSRSGAIVSWLGTMTGAATLGVSEGAGCNLVRHRYPP